MIDAAANLRRYAKFVLPASVCIFACLIGSAHAYRMMSWQEYKSGSPYDCPCFYQIRTRRGIMLYYGSKHVNSPDDPQYSQIQALWNEFHPETAFYEGPTLSIGQMNREQAIKTYGEPGLVNFLAKQHKVSVQSLDPNFEEEMAALQRKYDVEQLKLFYIVRQKTTYDEQSKSNSDLPSLESYLDQFIKNELRALKAAPISIDNLQSIYARHFPDKGNYSDANYDFVSPVPSSSFNETVFNEIARASSDYRDRVMLDRISRAAYRGKRVFAVVGFTHMIMQKPALIELLEKCP